MKVYSIKPQLDPKYSKLASKNSGLTGVLRHEKDKGYFCNVCVSFEWGSCVMLLDFLEAGDSNHVGIVLANPSVWMKSPNGKFVTPEQVGIKNSSLKQLPVRLNDILKSYNGEWFC